MEVLEVKTILVVDDLKEVRDLVEATLDVGDYTIIKAESGEKAIEIAKETKLDLIIMDVMMPNGIDGLATTKAIKNGTMNKEAKVIILSAQGQELDQQKGFDAGADDYFIKPFSPLDLITKVDQVLGELLD